MNTKDLEIFLLLAKNENMQQTAEACNCTPSMVSKALKRLETQCNTQLFLRRGKNIVLNEMGRTFSVSAAKIIGEIKQAQSLVGGNAEKSVVRISGPSILMFRWASVFSKNVAPKYSDCRIEFTTQYEQQALQDMINGAVDAAIITGDIQSAIPNGATTLSLGEVSMKIAAARNHPLFEGLKIVNGECCISAAHALEHQFVSTRISPFCGEERGLGCDGWESKKLPRKITRVVDYYGVLAQLVKSGEVLAYLPDYWLRELDLIQVNLSENISETKEQVLLVSYQASLANLLAS